MRERLKKEKEEREAKEKLEVMFFAVDTGIRF